MHEITQVSARPSAARPRLAQSSPLARQLDLWELARAGGGSVRWPRREGLEWRRRLASVWAEMGLGMHGAGAFTDELLARDAEAAGLRLRERIGENVYFANNSGSAVSSPAVQSTPLTPGQVVHVVRAVVHAELLLRRSAAPREWFARARRVGARARPSMARTALRAALSLVEPLVPCRRGCLRQTLAEVLADPAAAHEPVVLGLTPRATGHASFAHTTPWAPVHPVDFIV